MKIIKLKKLDKKIVKKKSIIKEKKLVRNSNAAATKTNMRTKHK
jgi:hypothetical protein